ncbi:MAG TPA: hypothetical protein VF146_10250 [Bryobacteraceae bacterium]
MTSTHLSFSSFRLPTAVVVLSLLTAFAALAAGPVITSATINPQANTLTIGGTNLLGSDGSGVFSVSLTTPSSTVITLSVTNSSPTSITATFPPGSPASSLAAGVYSLLVRCFSVSSGDNVASFQLTVGAGGVQTQTTLLYTFVTSQNGFDTGIVISNIVKDLASPGTIGTCKETFFGSAAPANPVITTPNINSGTVFTELASVIAPGFQGYMIAVCNFNAQGAAFVSDVGARNLAFSVPVVVSNP